ALDQFRFTRDAAEGVDVPVPAVAGVLEVGDLGQVDIALVAEEAVVRQRVVHDFAAPVVVVADVFAFEFRFDAALAVGDRRWFFGGRIWNQQDSPGAVVVDLVFADRVVAPSGDHDAAADRAGFSGARRRHVWVVV